MLLPNLTLHHSWSTDISGPLTLILDSKYSWCPLTSYVCLMNVTNIVRLIIRNHSLLILLIRCLSSMLSTLFFPLIPWLMQLILFAWFVGVMVFLVTSGSAEYRQIENNTLTNTICSAAVSDIVFFLFVIYCCCHLKISGLDLFWGVEDNAGKPP